MSIDPLVEEAEAGSEIYPHSTNISDYVFPTLVVASSEFIPPPLPSQNGDVVFQSDWSTNAGTPDNAKDGNYFTKATDATQNVNAPVGGIFRIDFTTNILRRFRAKFAMQINGATTDTMTIFIETSEDGVIWTIRDTITINTFDIKVEQDRTLGSFTSRYCRLRESTNNTFRIRFLDVWEIQDLGGQSPTLVKENAIDNNISTYWQSNSELNPFLRGEFSAIADKEPSAVALFIDKSKITSTQFLIQTSVDGVAWTLKRTINITQLTNLAYNFIRFNRDVLPIRYIRLVGNDGTSKTFAINEYRALIPTSTQWLERQTHKTISPTSTSIGLAG